MSLRSVFVNLLFSVDDTLNTLIREMIDNFSFPLIFSLIAASFLYGFIHSAGPGHGKTLITSLFLKEPHPLRKSLLLSAIVASVHSGSAVILSFLFTFVLTGIRGMFHITLQGYFTLAGGILILIIGIVFLIVRLSRKHHHHHVHDKAHGHTRNIYLIGLSAGMVPCPAALVIMLLTISYQATLIGVISVLSISLGIFSLLTVVGLITIRARAGLLRFAERRMHRGATVSTILEYASTFFIIIIGTTMIMRFVV